MRQNADTTSFRYNTMLTRLASHAARRMESPPSPTRTRGLSLDSNDKTINAFSSGSNEDAPQPIHRYVEFDINLHQFPYVAKNALQLLHAECFPKMITNIGIVIEARKEEELPEALLGSAKLIKAKKTEAMDEAVFWS